MVKSGVSAQKANVERNRTTNRRAAVLVRMPVIVPSTLAVAPDANAPACEDIRLGSLATKIHLNSTRSPSENRFVTMVTDTAARYPDGSALCNPNHPQNSY